MFPRVGWVASAESMLDSPLYASRSGFLSIPKPTPDLREHFPLESREEICRANFTVTDSIGPTFPRRFHVAKLWWLPRPNPVTRRTYNLSNQEIYPSSRRSKPVCIAVKFVLSNFHGRAGIAFHGTILLFPLAVWRDEKKIKENITVDRPPCTTGLAFL